MSSPIVTRGYLFTPSLIVTAGYVAGEVVVPPTPPTVIIRFRETIGTEYHPREPVLTSFQARSAVKPEEYFAVVD